MATLHNKQNGPATLIDPQLGTEGEFLSALMAIFRHLELTDQLEALLGQLLRWSGASGGFALASTDEPGTLVPLASTVPGKDPRFRALARLEAEPIRRALAAEPAAFDGLGPLATLLPHWPDGVPAASLVLPVLTPSEHWAAVMLLLFEARPETRTVRRLARLLELARPAVGHALRLQSMRDLVIRDDTAHCFNRRYFEEFLAEELARASRFHASLSLIFLDMDNLKQVNNRHGHSMGSRTLREVSARIRSKIRKFDKLFRFGGDEFCIVLPETEWQGATEVAERVRDAIAGRPFLVRELGVGNGVTMSASLGIAAYPLHARGQHELVLQADRAMQLVKRGTKNATRIAEVAGGEHER